METAGFKPSRDQAVALRWLQSGKNVFITGVAGSGKSWIVDYWMANHAHDKRVAITASTGIAATHLGGVTLHSWIGAKPGAKTISDIATDYWWENKQPALRSIDVLLIDEVSMIDGQFLNLAEEAHRAACNNARPWGGKQVVMIGDMGQLPPVQEEENGWSWESRAWTFADIHAVELCQTMRFADQPFADLLRRVRVGAVTDEDVIALSRRVRAYDPDAMGAVRLTTHNKKADKTNMTKLAALPGDSQVYKAQSEAVHARFLAQLEKNCLSPPELILKVGARVMFTKNNPDSGWCNGTTGEVLELHGTYAVVQIANGPVVTVYQAEWVLEKQGAFGREVLASYKQLPLRLAWAITIHKSQGCTIDYASVDMRQVFAPGQAYVALSRCRSLEGLNIESWRGAGTILVHPKIMEMASTS
jgi:ATP-dependent exoDNAse (exonuclease V) alpha subunit